ncbi:hypothetical protein ADUPG1_003664, partial [Aduncisulcus paluster]
MLRKVKFDAELCHRIYLCTEKFCIKFVVYLFKGTGKGRDMELFSAALLNFAFCDATRELTDDSSHVTSSPAPVVTLKRLLKSMVKISTLMFNSVSGQKSKAKYIIPNDKEESLEEEEEEEEDI